jgi:hypothetical protein
MWHPWRALAERVARDDLLEAASLDEVEAYQAAVHRIIGVAPMLPARPSVGDGPPPNAPTWPASRQDNQPAPTRFEDARDHRGPW